jgi:hypothetical protein
MAARAFDQPLPLPQARTAERANIVIHPRMASAYKPAPLAAMPRRTILNAAAHEAVLADIRLAGWLVVSACCIGLGLALGLHFDEILHDVRLMTYNAEEPRWLWSLVDSL